MPELRLDYIELTHVGACIVTYVHVPSLLMLVVLTADVHGCLRRTAELAVRWTALTSQTDCRTHSQTIHEMVSALDVVHVYTLSEPLISLLAYCMLELRLNYVA